MRTLPPELARAAEEMVAFGLSVWLQSAVVLALGLALGWYLERRAAAPVLRAAAYRVTLAAVALVLLAPVFGGLRTAGEPLVRVRIPALPRPVREFLPRLLFQNVPAASSEVRAVFVSSDGDRRVLVRRFASAEDRVLILRRAVGGAPGAAATPVPGLLSGLYAAAVVVYGAGAVLLLALLGFGLHSLRHLYKRSAPVEPGSALARAMDDAWRARRDSAPGAGRRAVSAPVLRTVPELEGPFLADAPGLPSPAIFVPAEAAARWSDAEARAVLAHELAHHARRDGWWNLVGRVLAALLWCQPLLYLLRRRLDEATEEACDAEALTWSGCEAHSLARCLMALMEQQQQQRPRRTLLRGGLRAAPTLGAASPAFRSSGGRRVARLLDAAARQERDPRQRAAYPSLSAPVCAALLAGALVAPSVAGRLVRVEAEAPAKVAQQRTVTEDVMVLRTDAAPFPAAGTDGPRRHMLLRTIRSEVRGDAPLPAAPPAALSAENIVIRL